MSGFSLLKKVVPGAACIATLLMSGCAFTGSSVVSTNKGVANPLSTIKLGGTARGGRQGIYKATISLYAMSTTTVNYGDKPTMYAQTTTSDSNGDFSFTKLADGLLSPVPTALAGNTTAIWSCPTGASSSTPGSAADPYMYLVSAGGDTSGSGTATSNYNNSFAKLIVVLGDCASISASTYVSMNEATTVASMVALQQFFNPMTQAIGAPGPPGTTYTTRPTATAASSVVSNVTGLGNAIAMLSNLVNISNGEFQTSVTLPSAVPGVSVVATPEFAKLNTMANVLASCVSSNPNSNPAACNVLVTNAVPPTTAPPTTLAGKTPGVYVAPVGNTSTATCSATASPVCIAPAAYAPAYNAVGTESAAVTNFPTITTYPVVADTLQAIDYMLINPTDSQDYLQGTGKLYGLYAASQTGTQPFSPVLTTQPSDWSVGIGFSVSGACQNLATLANGYPPFMNGEYGMAVDSIGNVWMGGTGSADVLAEISPTGVPLNCLTSVSGTGNGAGRRIAIDTSNNVWWNTSDGILEWVNGTSNSNPYNFQVWPNPVPNATYSSLTAANKPSGIAFDLFGNLFVSPDATSTTNTPTTTPPVVNTPTNMWVYANVAGATSATTTQPVTVGIALPSDATTSEPYRDVAIDKNGDLVTENTTNAYIYVFHYGGSATTWSNSYATAFRATNTAIVTSNGTAKNSSTDYGAGIDLNGYVWTGGTCCARAGGIFKTNAAATTAASAEPAGGQLFGGGGNSERTVIVDGANNVWASYGAYPADANASMGAIAEIDNSYNPIAPTGLMLSYLAGTYYYGAPGYCGGFAPSLCQTQGGFEKSFFNPATSAYAFALDASGNVWGANNLGVAAGATTAQTLYWVIVGQAVPVVTPVVANLP